MLNTLFMEVKTWHSLKDKIYKIVKVYKIYWDIDIVSYMCCTYALSVRCYAISNCLKSAELLGIRQ